MTAIERLRDLVNRQAEDEGLWFLDPLCSEAYLQAALRELHEAAEAVTNELMPNNLATK